jgi:phosphoserine phosphatase RsbU/P
MPKVPSLPKPLLAALAILFAAATILYSGLWMYSTRSGISVELGFDDQYLRAERCDHVTSVVPGSPAEAAGLRPGDCISAIYGRPLENAFSVPDVWDRHRAGDSVELTIRRPGVPAPVVLHGTFRSRRDVSNEAGVTTRVGEEITNTYPVAFLVVGLAVLFLRLRDRNAWLLALMFAGFISIPGFPNLAGLRPSLRSFLVAYRGVFDNMVAPFFYFFFSVFPARSPLDRRVPWLKWTSLVLGALLALPLWRGHDPASFEAAGLGAGFTRIFVLCFLYGLLALGLVSLISNATSAPTPEARRKIRMILWGTLVGVVPATVSIAAGDFFRFHVPLWLVAPIVLLLWLFPLSFAYAVVKHRVLEIPVLLKRSARYVLVQRGFIVLLLILAASAIALFTHTFSRFFQTGSNMGMTLSAVFGIALVGVFAPVVRRGTERIDRAFFRNAYDARMILQDLAERTRTATDRQELAALLERHLNEALRPSSFAVYLETHDGELSAAGGRVPPELATLSGAQPVLADLARRGRPWEVPVESLSPNGSAFPLAALKPDCLAPMLGRDGRLLGLLALGPRLSEEPYSSEDKRLLASVTSQAAMALEGIRLGEKIAERIEAERRAAQEMEFAREVQARLFPQKLPPLASLEYAGGCLQARQVGGDYYDFLELRPGRVALVLADIAGKGVSGALLMANLQANLRSQYALALDDLPRLLASVNHLFYENTAENSYATLFFADYDDSSRRLRYANCGHLPPLLLRAGEGSPREGCSEPAWQRLEPTCTVVGLFDDWHPAVTEVQLAPGDTLVLYTDGVTEAENAEGEQFGECRLMETICERRHLPVRSLLEAIIAKMQEFGGREQADDITLVVARCRS